MCFVEHPCCICSAPCAFQQIHSFMQQGGWIIFSGSGCCCMAEGATLSTLAQQHAYITEHVLGVIQPASVYSGVTTRLSSGTFTAPQVALQLLLTSASICKGLLASASLVKLQRLHVDAKPHPPAEKCKELQPRRARPPKTSVSAYVAAASECQEWMEEEGHRGKEGCLARNDFKAKRACESGGRKNTLTHYLWQENHPRAELRPGWPQQLLSCVDSSPQLQRRWGGKASAAPACSRTGL